MQCYLSSITAIYPLLVTHQPDHRDTAWSERHLNPLTLHAMLHIPSSVTSTQTNAPTNLPKECVLVCEFISSVEGDEELAGIIVSASIGHAHQATPVELETRVELILKSQYTQSQPAKIVFVKLDIP